jgi:hypothetical protein
MRIKCPLGSGNNLDPIRLSCALPCINHTDRETDQCCFFSKDVYTYKSTYVLFLSFTGPDQLKSLPVSFRFFDNYSGKELYNHVEIVFKLF